MGRKPCSSVLFMQVSALSITCLPSVGASCWHYFSPFHKGVLTTAFVVCILNAQQRGSPFGRVVFWNKPSATALLSVHSLRKEDRHKQSRFIYCMALHKEFILFLVLTLAHKNAFVLVFFLISIRSSVRKVLYLNMNICFKKKNWGTWMVKAISRLSLCSFFSTYFFILFSVWARF